VFDIALVREDASRESIISATHDNREQILSASDLNEKESNLGG
jgi:hypothetical protein